MGFCYLPFVCVVFAKYPEVWNLFSLSLHMARTCNQESMVSNSHRTEVLQIQLCESQTSP